MCSYEYRCEHFNYQFHYLSISFFFVTANALRIVIHYYIKYLSITDFLNVWMYAAIMCKKKKKKLITNKHHHRITLQEIQMTLINSRHSKPMKKKNSSLLCLFPFSFISGVWKLCNKNTYFLVMLFSSRYAICWCHVIFCCSSQLSDYLIQWHFDSLCMARNFYFYIFFSFCDEIAIMSPAKFGWCSLK